MARGNVELMRECFPMERSKQQSGHERKRSPDGLSLPNQNTIIINIIWQHFIRKAKKKYNEIQLTKNRNNGILKKSFTLHRLDVKKNNNNKL